MNDDLVLDFNNKQLKFKEEDILKYNVLTIEQNIKEFRRFTYELTLNEDFDEIFNTAVFQITFLDDTSNYVDNLIAVYNAIALNKLTNNRVYPTIDERSFIAQMKLRGFETYKTRLTLSPNNYRFVKKFRKNNGFVWK